MFLIQKSTNFIQNLKRPLGLSLAIIYMGIFAGLAPLAGTLDLFLNEESSLIYRLRTGFGPDIRDHIVILVFALTVIVSGISAWFGNNKARYIFLGAFTFYCAQFVFQLVSFATSDGVWASDPTALQWTLITSSIRMLVIVGICWWGFHSANAKRFYQGNPVRLAV